MIIGSHPRHAYVARRMSEVSNFVGIVIQKREKFNRDIPEKIDESLMCLYKKHFELRAEKEAIYFGGDENFEYIKKNHNYLEIEQKDLNSLETVSFLESLHADILISYGPNLIADEILNLYNDNAYNIHGGLSPWYKGSATMFWPFYFLEPNYVGTTIHHITSKIDAGKIIHQVVPKLCYGDTMHDVSCKAIVATCDDFKKLIYAFEREGHLEGTIQKGNGKLFLVKDWRPEHLRLIYETYQDSIVDLFLNGKINQNNNPKLIRAF